MKTVEDLVKIISGSGLKITPQRIAVLKALQSMDHPRAEEIYREVSRQMPGLSPTTVYNTLEVLVSKNIIRKVHTEADVMRYDAVPDQHHHLYCLQSDRMDDYFDPELDKLLRTYFEKKRINGFVLKDINLQLMGEFTNEKKMAEQPAPD